MSVRRYLVFLSILPLLVVALGLIRWWAAPVGVLAVLLVLVVQARRLGTSTGRLLTNLGRSYATLPRLLWSRDVAAMARACGPEAQLMVEEVEGTRFATDLEPVQARELQATVRQVNLGLRELLPGSRPADRVLLFAHQPAMLAYLHGFYGHVGDRAAGFCFAQGAVRVAGAVDAFSDLGRDPRALLAHELVHGGLRGVTRGVAMHPWINEGLAEALAAQWTEPARLPGIRRLMRRLRAKGQWLEWDELRGVRPGTLLGWVRSEDRLQAQRAQMVYSEGCLLLIELLARESGEHSCLRAVLERPRRAEEAMRQHLGFGGQELLAWVAREVDAAPLALTPWDRARRETLRSQLDRGTSASFRKAAVLGFAACGDGEDIPRLEGLVEDDDPVVAGHARTALELIRSDTLSA